MNTHTFHLPESRVASVLEVSLLDAPIDQVAALAMEAATLGAAAVLVSYRHLPSLADIKDTHPALKISVAIDLPEGDNGPWEIGECARFLHKQGVDEITVSLPLDTLHRDSGELIRNAIEAARQGAPGTTIKALISEKTGHGAQQTTQAAAAALCAGADFIQISADTPQATDTLLKPLLAVLFDCPAQAGVSLAIARPQFGDLETFWQSIERVMGVQWCHKKRFRLVTPHAHLPV